MHLAEASGTWHRLKGRQPAVMNEGLQEPAGRDYAEYFHPKTLLFEPFTRDYDERYVQSPLPAESAQNAVLDLGRRIGLLLGTLLTIPVVNTRSTGLRAKLTPAMTQHIRLQRESGSKNSEE